MHALACDSDDIDTYTDIPYTIPSHVLVYHSLTLTHTHTACHIQAHHTYTDTVYLQMCIYS